MMIGVELRETGAVARLVDGDGAIREAIDVERADLAASALEAIDRLVASAGPEDTIGVASAQPEAPATVRALESIAARHSGRLRLGFALGSGTAAAVAEAWIGAARNARDVVYFGVAEHATAGIVRRGEPVVGSHRRAPAVGWLSLNPVEREDYRKTGCLEAEVAAAGTVRRLVWRIKAGDASRVADLVKGDLAAITVEHVLAGARNHDGVAVSVVRDTAKYLGMAAANLVAIADPEVLVLGGFMASAADLLLEPLRVELARRVPPAMMNELRIVTAALGADAVALGAARLGAATLP